MGDAAQRVPGLNPGLRSINSGFALLLKLPPPELKKMTVTALNCP